MSGDQKDKRYGAYKVSDQTHQNYKVDESQGVPARQEIAPAISQAMNQEADIDHKKRYTKGEKGKNMKQEFKSTKEALQDFSPWQWKKQMNYIKQLTPEEYETMLRCKQELKSNTRVYGFWMAFAAVSFAHWQRQFLPRGFRVFALFTGYASGCFLGLLQSGGYFVQSMDQLGKEYELSRMVKQDIFDTRPDISSGMRAQYYQHQQKETQQLEDELLQMQEQAKNYRGMRS